MFWPYSSMPARYISEAFIGNVLICRIVEVYIRKSQLPLFHSGERAACPIIASVSRISSRSHVSFVSVEKDGCRHIF